MFTWVWDAMDSESYATIAFEAREGKWWLFSICSPTDSESGQCRSRYQALYCVSKLLVLNSGIDKRPLAIPLKVIRLAFYEAARLVTLLLRWHSECYSELYELAAVRSGVLDSEVASKTSSSWLHCTLYRQAGRDPVYILRLKPFSISGDSSKFRNL